MPQLFDPNSPMHNAAKDGPINMTPEEENLLRKTLRDLNGSVAFLYELSQSRTLQKSDALTHLSLLRHVYEDLSKQLQCESYLSDELEFARKQLREANQEIRALKETVGNATTAEAGEAFLSNMERTLTTWYVTAGFHYAHTEIYPHGLSLDFSNELEPDERYGDDQRPPMASETLYKPMRRVVQYQFGENSGYRTVSDGSRIYLLDCDVNRSNLKALFADYFPNSNLNGFESRRERGQYILSPKIHIAFTDIKAILDRAIQATNQKEENKPQ